MSKCLKCGAMLPPVGDCPACAATVRQPAGVPAVPSLLDRDIQIDRRRMPDRGQEAPTVQGVPAFADLAAHAPPPPPSVAPLSTPLPAPRAAAPQQRPAAPQPGAAAPRAAQPPAPQPGVAAPRAAQPAPQPGVAAQPSAPQPGVAAPRATVPPPGATAPRAAPASPMTPAFGTPPAIRAQAPAPAPQPAAAAPAGLPRMEPAAAAPAGLPRMEAPAPSGPPRMESAPAAPVGLPRMGNAAPAGLPRMEAPAPGLPRMDTLPAAPASLPEPETVPPALAAVSAPREEKSRAPAPARNASGVKEVHARPASLWRRLLSFSIDAAAIAGVAALYITLASSVTGVKAPEAGLVGLDAFVAWLRALNTVLLPGFVLVLILALVYCAVAAFLWNGRTLGRLLLGLRLVDTHGLAPAPGRAIVRAMLASVSFVLFLGGFWMALFDRRGQTLHDKLTSTFVVQPS